MKKFTLTVSIKDYSGAISELKFSARTFAECANVVSMIEDSEDFDLVAVVCIEYP